MSQEPGSKKPGGEEDASELSEEELDQVDGGASLLLPAIQQAREAEKKKSELPVENVSLHYEKIEL